jgi:photosystem II stability/assembly factor-like uncharacterized protein
VTSASIAAPPVTQSRRRAEPTPFVTAAHAKSASMLLDATAVRQAWRPLGPFAIPHGQTYGEGRGSRPSVSARISSVAVDPGNARHLLIGSGGGGVWESHDDGATWAPRTDDQPSLSIGAIAFDPTNPTIVYAGTGEGDDAASDGSHSLGAGLLRSADGGTTWAVHARAPLERLGFFDIVVDPADGQHLLAGTSMGLFRSQDGGVTWTRRRNAFTWKISIATLVRADGTTAPEILAACADGVFRSTTGASWTQVALPGASAAFSRVEVCHAPSDPNVAYVFGARAVNVPRGSTTGQAAALVGRIWRRASFGGTFSAVPLPPDIDTGQAWYDWHAAVAPNNPNILYAGAINLHRGVRDAANLWKWTNISAKQTSGDSIHPDQHAMAFSPNDPNVVYAANDGGIFRSPDAGVTWMSLNKGLNITQVEFLAQHPRFETWLLAGTQDNGTLRYQGDTVWFHVGDGDGGDCGVNASAPYTCYHTFYGMGVARSTKGGDWNSFTGPPDYTVGPPFAEADTYPAGSLFYPPVDVNGRVVAQAGKSIFFSNNDGTSWTSVPLNLGRGEFASALVLATATRAYCGTNDGRLFRTEFLQGAWQAPVPLTSPDGGYMSDLLVDPTDANRLYASYTSSFSGARIFRSTDGGATWTRADAGIPQALPVNAIEIDRANPTTLFCAADLGVYITRNSGGAWSAFSDGLPNALVKDLAFHAPSRLLRAGTQSRGVWEIAVDAATMPDVEIYLRDSSVDSGRLSPSPSGVDDPFVFGAQTFWWQCRDIKVDAPSFLRPSIGDIDFEIFSDDQSLRANQIEFAAGLANDNPQRNQTVRVYVQIHNRGIRAATNVAVKVFFAAGGLTFPDLPATFWTNFPNNVVDAASPWHAVAAHQVIAAVDAGRSHIAGFEWRVPANAPAQIALLAIISAENDTLATTERNVATLVTTQKKCGLRNLAVVNPSPHSGPPVHALPLHVDAQQSAVRIGIDRGGQQLTRAIVLPKRLEKSARAAGWKIVRMSPDDRLELERAIASDPRLKSLAKANAWAPAKRASMLSLDVPRGREQPVVLLLEADPGAGRGSVILEDAGGQVIGGMTLHAQSHSR